MNLKVKLIDDFVDFFLLENDYRTLYNKQHIQNPFLSWEWISAWVHIYQDKIQLFTCLFIENEKLKGVAPLYFEKNPRNQKKKILRIIGDRYVGSENLGVLVDKKDFFKVFRWLFNLTQHQKLNVSFYFFDDIRQNSTLINFLYKNKKNRSFLYTIRPKNTCPILKLTKPSNFPDFVQKHYMQAKNKTKKLFNNFDGSIDFIHNDRNSNQQLDDLFFLHQKLWNSRSEPGSFNNKQKRDFYCLISKDFLQNDWLDLYTLKINNKAVASYYGFSINQTYYYLQSGFDPDYSKYSVGTVLFYKILNDLRNKNIKYVDFLRGDEKYKYLWGAQNSQSYSVYLYHNSVGNLPNYYYRQLKYKIKSSISFFY